MKTVTGTIGSQKPVSIAQACLFLTEFVDSENGASQAVSAYLRRASVAFNELLRVHSRSLGNQDVECEVRVDLPNSRGSDSGTLDVAIKQKEETRTSHAKHGFDGTQGVDVVDDRAWNNLKRNERMDEETVAISETVKNRKGIAKEKGKKSREEFRKKKKLDNGIITERVIDRGRQMENCRVSDKIKEKFEHRSDLTDGGVANDRIEGSTVKTKEETEWSVGKVKKKEKRERGVDPASEMFGKETKGGHKRESEERKHHEKKRRKGEDDH